MSKTAFLTVIIVMLCACAQDRDEALKENAIATAYQLALFDFCGWTEIERKKEGGFLASPDNPSDMWREAFDAADAKLRSTSVEKVCTDEEREAAIQQTHKTTKRL